jgi:hypothetical protein
VVRGPQFEKRCSSLLAGDAMSRQTAVCFPQGHVEANISPRFRLVVSSSSGSCSPRRVFDLEEKKKRFCDLSKPRHVYFYLTTFRRSQNEGSLRDMLQPLEM